MKQCPLTDVQQKVHIEQEWLSYLLYCNACQRWVSRCTEKHHCVTWLMRCHAGKQAFTTCRSCCFHPIHDDLLDEDAHSASLIVASYLLNRAEPVRHKHDEAHNHHALTVVSLSRANKAEMSENKQILGLASAILFDRLLAHGQAEASNTAQTPCNTPSSKAW